MYDHLWLCTTIFDYVWLCMAIYSYVWLCMVIDGYMFSYCFVFTDADCMLLCIYVSPGTSDGRGGLVSNDSNETNYSRNHAHLHFLNLSQLDMLLIEFFFSQFLVHILLF